MQDFSKVANQIYDYERIMSVCKGTLWIVDRSFLVYNRLWCLYEAYKSTIDVAKNREHKFDVYTAVKDKDVDRRYGAVGITDGYIPSDHGNSLLKTERELKFPLDRVLEHHIIRLDIKKSVTTVEEDRKYILNKIAGQSIDEFNNVLKSVLLAPMMERIKKEVQNKATVDCCLEILKSLRPGIIDIKLNNNSVLDDVNYQKIKNINLPSTIEEVRIIFQGRYHVDGNEVKELENYKGLPTESVDIPNTSIGKIISEYLYVKLSLVFCSSDAGVYNFYFYLLLFI